LLRASLKFYISTRRFIIMTIIYVILTAIGPIVVALKIEPNAPDVYSFTQGSFSGFSYAVILVAAILAGDALSQDFGRQGLFTLTQPVRRLTILLSRYIAASLVSGAIILVLFDVVGFALSQYYYGQIVPNAALITGASLLLVAAMVATVVLFSSLFKSPVISIVVAVLFFILAIPIISGVLSFTNIEPWFLITYGGDVVGALAGQTYPPHLTTQSFTEAGTTITISTYTPTLLEGTAIMLAYLIGSLLLAWVIYSRKEIKETA
jgi:ABC-2 type transport system permease protein